MPTPEDAIVCRALAVLAGGFLGGVARFWLSAGASASGAGERFPWGTLAVNVSGSALIGVLAGLAQRTGGFGGPVAHDFLLTGVCGGYTTVSSFALQTAVLWTDREARAAALYVAATVAGSLAAVAAGYAAAALA